MNDKIKISTATVDKTDKKTENPEQHSQNIEAFASYTVFEVVTAATADTNLLPQTLNTTNTDPQPQISNTSDTDVPTTAKAATGIPIKESTIHSPAAADMMRVKADWTSEVFRWNIKITAQIAIMDISKTRLAGLQFFSVSYILWRLRSTDWMISGIPS